MTLSAHPDLFEHASAQAARLRDSGMALASAAQERDEPGWGELAYAAIVSIAQRQETVHVDDLLREFRRAPGHANSWGGVWRRAIKNGVIEHSGQVRACMTDATKRKHLCPVYDSLIVGRAP